MLSPEYAVSRIWFDSGTFRIVRQRYIHMAENKVSVWTRENLYVGESELRVQQKSFFPIAIELPSQGSLLFSHSSIIKCQNVG
jgi:regulatory protein YycH of two-component signal transduction system YycFG